jgi:hypothetical protein
VNIRLESCFRNASCLCGLSASEGDGDDFFRIDSCGGGGNWPDIFSSGRAIVTEARRGNVIYVSASTQKEERGHFLGLKTTYSVSVTFSWG